MKLERQKIVNFNNNHKKEYEKSKIFQPMIIKPLPLTFLKPFNLSSNNNIKLKQKGMVNNNEAEINMFIKNLMERKEEAANEEYCVNASIQNINNYEFKKYETKYKLSTHEKEYQTMKSYPKFKAKSLDSKIFGGTTRVVNNDISLFEGKMSTTKLMIQDKWNEKLNQKVFIPFK